MLQLIKRLIGRWFSPSVPSLPVACCDRCLQPMQPLGYYGSICESCDSHDPVDKAQHTRCSSPASAVTGIKGGFSYNDDLSPEYLRWRGLVQDYEGVWSGFGLHLVLWPDDDWRWQVGGTENMWECLIQPTCGRVQEILIALGRDELSECVLDSPTSAPTAERTAQDATAAAGRSHSPSGEENTTRLSGGGNPACPLSAVRCQGQTSLDGEPVSLPQNGPPAIDGHEPYQPEVFMVSGIPHTTDHTGMAVPVRTFGQFTLLPRNAATTACCTTACKGQ